MSPPFLKRLLESAIAGTITHRDLSELIYLCRSIAESYLIHHRSSFLYICAANGLSVSDIALDCIAEIFARNETDQFYTLQNFEASLHANLEQIEEKGLFLAFNSFVITLAKARLARILSQADPFGAKIHRNIKDYVKRSKTILLIEDFRGYVLQPREEDSLDQLPAFPPAQLECELVKRVGTSTSTPEMIDALADIFISHEEYRRSVPLIDLVQIFKRLFTRFDEAALQHEATQDLQNLSEGDLTFIKAETLSAVNEKIISTYYRKGKISKPEAQLLSETMESVITNWFDDKQIENSFYSHIARIQPIPKEEYEQRWRKKVEYLARIARETIMNCLTDTI